MQDEELNTLTSLVRERIVGEFDIRRISAMLRTLKERMQKDIVRFEYDKVGGEHRVAFGTRNPKIIDRYGGTPRSEKDNIPTVFHYYDLYRQAWRSFRPENLLDIDCNYTI